jgi:hypothetical protein
MLRQSTISLHFILHSARHWSTFMPSHLDIVFRREFSVSVFPAVSLACFLRFCIFTPSSASRANNRAAEIRQCGSSKTVFGSFACVCLYTSERRRVIPPSPHNAHTTASGAPCGFVCSTLLFTFLCKQFARAQSGGGGAALQDFALLLLFSLRAITIFSRGASTGASELQFAQRKWDRFYKNIINVGWNFPIDSAVEFHSAR